jgi:glycosyltransferase involved in cell wall biosynthesis
MDFVQKCHHVVIPSQSMKEFLVNEYGLETGYTVIPTGINLEPFLQADGKALRKEKGWQDETILISVGRLAAEKNWETLLRAFAKVSQTHPNIRLVLIGDGPDRDTLEALASELGIAEHLAFTGALHFEEIPSYLKAADLFCFASVTETQGLVTMEAMAAGLPVVAVDGSGTRDIVEQNKQGFLVENDADALANGIEQLLSEPQKMKRFSTQALKKAKTFDINGLGKQMIAVYEEAIEAKKEERTITLKAETAPGQEAVPASQT